MGSVSGTIEIQFDFGTEDEKELAKEKRQDFERKLKALLKEYCENGIDAALEQFKLESADIHPAIVDDLEVSYDDTPEDGEKGAGEL